MSATITARDLRAILFDIQDQELTVAEVRAILFTIEAQDTERTTSEIARDINNRASAADFEDAIRDIEADQRSESARLWIAAQASERHACGKY